MKMFQPEVEPAIRHPQDGEGGDPNIPREFRALVDGR
jgi:hypothetical protein